METYNYFKQKTGKKSVKKPLKKVPISGKTVAEKLLPKPEKEIKIKYLDESLIKGTLIGNERGYAFLVPEEGGEDYFISHTDLYGAQHGDVVLAKKKDETGKRTTARVVKIVERGVKEVVGTFSSCRRGGFVIVDDRKYFSDIFVPYDLSKKAKTGDKVVCKILFYPKGQNPEGEIIEVLGRQFSRVAEVKSIAVANKIETVFMPEVVARAEEVAVPVTEKDIIGRRDFRNDITVTIDGADAKDFDDAICVKKLENGDYLLGVHIADVSHYVRENDILDASAMSRATSVYFPENVIPMLPERLSNDVCSLMPGVDRLTLSCVMRINAKGEVCDNEIVPSVIKSKARLTYDTAYKILCGETVEGVNKEIVDMITTAGELADILIAKRTLKGSIDLDVKEAKITVNKGKVEVGEFDRNKAHKLIEEFMICANETVAEYAYYIGLPFIYRVHENPATDKVESLMEFLRGLGINRRWHVDNVYPKDFQALLTELSTANSPLFGLINRVMLRSMQKAKYMPENLGHFGLASKCYTHFTSPIRRYPDLAIHRILKAFLRGEEVFDSYENFVEQASNISNAKERGAELAERAVDDYYKLLYMSDKIGEEYVGIISGVQGFGFFVELKNTVEGIVKIETLSGKDYSFDDKKYTLSSKENCYKLGQEVEIVVVGVDMGNKRAEFMLKEDFYRCKKG